MNWSEIPSSVSLGAGILGTILLGALGSGFWNLVLGPILSKFGKIIIRISSLGLKSLQNKLYYEASKGKRIHLLKIVAFLVFLLIFAPLNFVMGMKSYNARHEGYIEKAVILAKEKKDKAR
ncbi:MAG: hypothetical protein JW847_01630 [Candidatus Omnitrophica bacterium]|nr:hypothetical protein [Candidatus Omnitrophota bacterium]